MTTFADVLRELGRGSIQAELSEKLANLVQSVRDTQRGGSLTFTLKLMPINLEALTTEVLINVKHPQPKRKNTVFFHTDEGDLLRDHPGQQTFPHMLDDEAQPENKEQKA